MKSRINSVTMEYEHYSRLNRRHVLFFLSKNYHKFSMLIIFTDKNKNKSRKFE